MIALHVRDEMKEKDYKDFETQKEILLEYLQVMIALQDWHGVADVAMDLRELEAKQFSKEKK
jgi:hypothetical protein